MPSIVITSPFVNTEHGPSAELLRRTGYPSRVSLFDPARTAAELIPVLHDAIAAIVAVDPLDATVLEQAPLLRVIARVGVGYDAVDVQAASARDIVVCTTVGSNARAVAEHTWGLILAVARRIPAQHAAVQAGGWKRHVGTELAGKTLGIVGFGMVGQAVARRGLAFEMRVLAHDIAPDEEAAQRLGITLCDLATVLAEADVLSIHASLTPSSRGLIGAAALRQMKPGAILVNTSRGSIVDQEALAAALHAGTLGGAGLDVFATEPPGPALAFFEGVPNVVFTPHGAGITVESVARGASMAVESVTRVLAGRRPLTAVNPEVVERLGLR
ncbi:MAG TPA: phosphoglycerate dehydrogenase [Chloroflexota bacterium]|nr:phosphoglycerate dehydrogenase [Chloroflexota bacterium]